MVLKNQQRKTSSDCPSFLLVHTKRIVVDISSLDAIERGTGPDSFSSCAAVSNISFLKIAELLISFVPLYTVANGSQTILLTVVIFWVSFFLFFCVVFTSVSER